MGRNPKSGDAVALSGKYVPHFKPGKELRERVNSGFAASLNKADASNSDSASIEDSNQKTGTND